MALALDLLPEASLKTLLPASSSLFFVGRGGE
jgi:hypothetical protein